MNSPITKNYILALSIVFRKFQLPLHRLKKMSAKF